MRAMVLPRFGDPGVFAMAAILPVSGYSTISGVVEAAATTKRVATSPGFQTWWAPSAPRGKWATSPGRSSRSPAGVRSVGVPSSTSSSSSAPWWKWYGRCLSPGSTTYTLMVRLRPGLRTSRRGFLHQLSGPGP